MDQVYNALTMELAYDVCANQINASIQSYKDGKDKSFIGGQQDIDDKNDSVNRFYNRLKQELEVKRGTNTNYTIDKVGTQVGKYLFTNDKDMVASNEAFDVKLDSDSSKNCVWDSIAKEELIKIIDGINAQSNVIIHLNKDAYKIAKVENARNFKNEIPESFKKDKRLLKEILVDIPKDKLNLKIKVPASITSLEEFMRNSLEAFNGLTDDNYSYYTRYIERYKSLKDIILIVLNTLKNATDTFKTLLDKGSGEPITHFKKELDVFDKAYSNLISAKCTDIDDVFPFRYQGYELSITKLFTFDKIDPDWGDYGVKFSDYLIAEKENKSTRKPTFKTIKCPGTIETVYEKLKSVDGIGSGKIDMGTLNEGIDIYRFVGDMTVGDFFNKLESLENMTKDFDKKHGSTITELFNLIDASFRNISKAAHYFKMTVLDYLEQLPTKSKEFNYSRTIVSAWINSLTNVLTCAEAMEYCNTIDNVRKRQLFNLLYGLCGYINNLIAPKLGE